MNCEKPKVTNLEDEILDNSEKKSPKKQRSEMIK